MAIYVDPLRLHGKVMWCHMASDQLGQDGLSELHMMADKIGAKREWFQDRPNLPHYDLQRRLRGLAIQRGAAEVGDLEFLRRCSTSPLYRRESAGGNND